MIKPLDAAVDDERDKINELTLQTLARFEQTPDLDPETAIRIVSDVFASAMEDMACELVKLRNQLPS